MATRRGKMEEIESITPTVEERFWSKVVMGADGECWEWIAYKTCAGYGRFHLNGSPHYAHRIAWELAFGPIPVGMCVLHHCDNPSCVNPSHLFLGTQNDNVTDMICKERQAQGEQKGAAKLTKEDVLEICRLWHEEDLSQRVIARMFGVAQSRVSRIVCRKSWRHLKASNGDI